MVSQLSQLKPGRSLCLQLWGACSSGVSGSVVPLQNECVAFLSAAQLSFQAPGITVCSVLLELLVKGGREVRHLMMHRCYKHP